MNFDLIFQEDILNILSTILCLFLLDQLLKKINLHTIKSTNNDTHRYFILHTILNSFIVYLTTGSLIEVMGDPINSMERSISRQPLGIVIGLHIYHLIGFSNLTLIDWLHHVISVFILGGIGLIYQYGPLTNFNLFFSCGLPGGIDYLLLALVKSGKITALCEKNINRYLNIWIRAPGLILYSFMAYQIKLYKDSEMNWGIIILAILITSGNGLYFADRVVGNTAETNLRASLEKKLEIAAKMISDAQDMSNTLHTKNE